MASGAYNRKKGYDYERQIVREMREFYPEAITSRNGSRDAASLGDVDRMSSKSPPATEEPAHIMSIILEPHELCQRI